MPNSRTTLNTKVTAEKKTLNPLKTKSSSTFAPPKVRFHHVLTANQRVRWSAVFFGEAPVYEVNHTQQPVVECV